MAKFRETLVSDWNVLDVASSVGWLINIDKSSLIPSQQVTYLGVDIDLCRGLAFPTREKEQAVRRALSMLHRLGPLPARGWLYHLGYLVNLVDLVPLYW